MLSHQIGPTKVQRKQWRVAELQRAWHEKLLGFQLERSLVAERSASTLSLTTLAARQLDVFSEASDDNNYKYELLYQSD